MKAKVVKVNKFVPSDKRRYDIMVEHSHCFFANDILVHNSSTHLSFSKTVQNGAVTENFNIFAGGESHVRFCALFDSEKIKNDMRNECVNEITIYGEAYGGSQQDMSYLYGKDLRFIVFDIKLDNIWLTVPKAEELARKLGLEFVYYEKIACTLEEFDRVRDADSVQAVRNGVDLSKLPEGKTALREGAVLRPLIEVFNCYGDRIMCKHKSDKFSERKTPQKVVDPTMLKVLSEASEIADEWVTPNRLEHVLQKLPTGGMEIVSKLIPAMVEDVLREAAGEIVDTKEARKAIGKKAVELFKKKLESSVRNSS